MKPLIFERPESVDALVASLRGGEEAGLLAGGTDLIVQLRSGRRRLGRMIDVKRVPELTELRFDPREGLFLGAAVACATVASSPEVQQHYAALADGAALIGSTQIQNRASIGGNLCNGSPAADTVCPLIVLKARCLIAGASGRREVAAEDFILGPGRTALKADEILVGFSLPLPAANSQSAYLRFIPRNEMDIAVVNAACALTLNGGGVCAAARVAVGAAAPTPLRIERAEAALEGTALDEGAIARAAAAACEAVSPISDMRGTEAYRRHMAGVLTKRSVALAQERLT